ncbi:hypothetical protein D1871_05735 [Nakamurella silvestris]|nr:hypothetical protein D1871_05735 [Nakamurella silvestris]
MMASGVAAVTLVAAAAADEGVEFNFGTLILFVLGALALIFVCMLGPISRMYEHRAERRREERAAADAASADNSLRDLDDRN